MKSYNTLASLESIPKATIYSKYGESLDKLFKSRSLKNLISELKNPKKYISKELSSEEDKKKKVVKYKEEDFKDIFFTLEQEHENKKDNYIKKNNKNLIEKEKYKPKILIKNAGFMDPFKYNPNYNSISKNIPSVRMILNDKKKKELNLKKKGKKVQKLEKLKI